MAEQLSYTYRLKYSVSTTLYPSEEDIFTLGPTTRQKRVSRNFSRLTRAGKLSHKSKENTKNLCRRWLTRTARLKRNNAPSTTKPSIFHTKKKSLLRSLKKPAQDLSLTIFQVSKLPKYY